MISSLLCGILDTSQNPDWTEDQLAGQNLTGQKWGAGESNSNAIKKRPPSEPSMRTALPVEEISVLR